MNKIKSAIKAALRRLLKKLMDTDTCGWIILHWVPYIRFTTYYTSLRGWKYHLGYSLLQPGDILLSADRQKLTNLMIGGPVSHAGQCVSKNGRFEVAEMTHHDFTHSTFFDFCKECDRVIIIRCRDYDPEYILKVIEKCLSFDYEKYDTHFEMGIEALYCSELVYQSDFERRLKVDISDEYGFGGSYISPKGLLAALNCDIVWDSDTLHVPNEFKI